MANNCSHPGFRCAASGLRLLIDFGGGILERSDAFATLVRAAHGYMTACQDNLQKEFRLWDWPRYDWYQESGTLVFSDSSGPKVIADIEFVDSISTKSDSWLWSWANKSLLPKVNSRIAHVKAYGEQNGLPQLATDYWHAHEVDGWEMSSIAGYLLNAKGAYRTPSDTGFTFMVMMDVRWAS